MKMMAAVLLTVLSVAAFGAVPGSGQAVRAELTRCLQAFVNGDAETFAGCFAEDITLFNPEIPGAETHRLDGRETVAAHFRRLIDNARQAGARPPLFKIEPKNVGVQMFGDVAVATFEFDRDGGSLGRRTFVFAWRDNHWRVVHIHASNTSGKPL
jgi:ketosteroid isomerase-like protein